jgi:hypothetical protein
MVYLLNMLKDDRWTVREAAAGTFGQLAQQGQWLIPRDDVESLTFGNRISQRNDQRWDS